MSTCQNCDKEFAPKDKRFAKFCSKSCAASFNNRAFPKRKAEGSKVCPVCHSPKRPKYRTCSHSCGHNLLYTEFIERWLAGRESGLSGKEGTSAHIRRWLLERANSRCEKCGWNEVNSATGKIPVQINHINGKWDDNRPENLEILCPNCHSLTVNYGGANRGNGRPGRYDK